MIIPSTKQIYLIIIASIAGLMSYGLYTQYVDGLEPCPLCMTQRFFYCLIGFFALLAVLHHRARIAYTVLLILSALGGVATAGRQVWLQHLPPDQVPACGPSLEYMLETFPIGDTLKALLAGDGNCAEVVWSFLGLSMGEWSLLWFLGFVAVGVFQLIRKPSA